MLARWPYNPALQVNRPAKRMPVSKRLSVSLVFATALIVLGPPAYRTIQLASSADGLLLLSWFSDEDFSLNPWSKDCYLIRQDTAASILINFEWPYSRRHSAFRGVEPAPLIHQAISSRGLSGLSGGVPYETEADHRLMSLLKHFVEKGHSIDQPWDGYTPIHSAILAGDTEVVEYLVEQGADLQAVIRNPGKANDGMNSFEFSKLLVAKRPQDFQAITAILASANSN